MHQIHRIGIEVEGEFSHQLTAKLRGVGRVSLVRDGSVRLIKNGYGTHEPREMRLGPVAPDRPHWREVIQMLARGYTPNITAGLHVHVSLKDGKQVNIKDGSLFWSGFAAFVKRRLFEDWPREMLERRNATGFCEIGSSNGSSLGNSSNSEEYDARLRIGINGRYQFINQCAFNRHRTIEFRVWPSASPKQMVKMVEWTIAVVREWLAMSGEVVKTEAIMPAQLDRVERFYHETIRMDVPDIGYRVGKIDGQAALEWAAGEKMDHCTPMRIASIAERQTTI